MITSKLTLVEMPYDHYHVRLGGIGIAMMCVSYKLNLLLQTSEKMDGYHISSDKILEYPVSQPQKEQIHIDMPSKWVETKDEGIKYIQSHINKFLNTLPIQQLINLSSN